MRNSVRLTIHGDYFDRDTRALLAICDMAEVAAEFVIVDTFNGGNLEESYQTLNPSQTIPMVSQGALKAQGTDSKRFFQFLLENQARIKATFYHSNQAALTNELFTYLYGRVRPISNQLIAAITDEKIFSKSRRTKSKANGQNHQTNLRQLMAEYLTQVAGLEEHLAKYDNLTGMQMTYVDVAMYIELDTV